MCSAYEVGGKNRGSDPNYVPASAVAAIIAAEAAPRIVRPTTLAPVVMPDMSVRTMLWGFRLSISGKPRKNVVFLP